MNEEVETLDAVAAEVTTHVENILLQHTTCEVTASGLLLHRLHHFSCYSDAIQLRCCHTACHFLLYHHVSFSPY
jgi:hypothetical protein